MARFLIVRLGALGDIVHAIPVAAALRRAFPSADIDWLVSAKHAEILGFVPAITRRVIVNDRAGSRGGMSIGSAIRALRRTRYDVALDLQGLIKSAAIARASGAARVVGFSVRHLREPLARAFYSETYDPGGDGLHARRDTRHVVTINLGMLDLLGVPEARPEFPLAEGDRAIAHGMRDRSGGAYALLNPGAAWPNKRWPPERLAEVARELHARHGLSSVVLWGPGERELAEAVVAGAPECAIVVPPTTIADVIALARRAAVMVSGDTGPMHIASAVGTPLVGLYGPTRPERNGPWLPDDITISRAEQCQCHHRRRCKLETMCLLGIEVSEVLDAIRWRLESAGRSSQPERCP